MSCKLNGQGTYYSFRSESGPYYTTAIPLANIEIPNEIINITASYPGVIAVGVPFVATYIVQNLTLHIATLVSHVDSAEGFVFSGYKQERFQILPLSSHTIRMRVLPLLGGRQALPRLQVHTTANIALTDVEFSILAAGKEGNDIWVHSEANLAWDVTRNPAPHPSGFSPA